MIANSVRYFKKGDGNIKKYKVKVTVGYSDVIEVEAKTDDEAKEKTREIVGSDDYDSYYLENFEFDKYEIVSSEPIDEIRIELEQGYFSIYDTTIIWEYTYKGDEMIKETIVGYYHGEPTKEDLKKFAYRGVSGVIGLDSVFDSATTERR